MVMTIVKCIHCDNPCRIVEEKKLAGGFSKITRKCIGCGGYSYYTIKNPHSRSLSIKSIERNKRNES